MKTPPHPTTPHHEEKNEVAHESKEAEVKIDEEPEKLEESEEQASSPKTRRAPKAPKKAEREAHEPGRLP